MSGTYVMPPETRASIDRYVLQRIPTGDFTRAVLENDLRESFGRADDYNRMALFEIVRYCYNEIPGACSLIDRE